MQENFEVIFQSSEKSGKKTEQEQQQEDGLSGKLQSNTFTLEVELNHNILSIVLKDFVDWKVYARKYTKEDIGKDINAKLELEDIFYGLIGDKEQLFLQYRFGDIVKHKSCQLIVNANGKIEVTSKIRQNVEGQTSEGSETSILVLSFVRQLSEKQKFELMKQMTRKQLSLTYRQQIQLLKIQNNELKIRVKGLQSELKLLIDKKCQRKYYMKIFIKLQQGDVIQVIVQPSDSVLKLKGKISDQTGIPVQEQRLIFAGLGLEDRISLVNYNLQRSCTLTLVRRGQNR